MRDTSGQRSPSEWNEEETDFASEVRSRRNSLRQSVRSPMNTPESAGTKNGRVSRAEDKGDGEIVDSTPKNAGTTRKRAPRESKSSARSRKKTSLDPTPQTPTTSTSPKPSRRSRKSNGGAPVKRRRSAKTDKKDEVATPSKPLRGKEAKLVALREEHHKLASDVRKLKREVDIWNNRIKTGRRLAKFVREIKPIEDEIKKYEPEWKELKTKITANKGQIEKNEKHVKKMLSDVKKVLAGANITIDEDQLSDVKESIRFLKSLSAREMAAIREAASKMLEC